MSTSRSRRRKPDLYFNHEQLRPHRKLYDYRKKDAPSEKNIGIAVDSAP